MKLDVFLIALVLAAISDHSVVSTAVLLILASLISDALRNLYGVAHGGAP